MSLVVNTNVNSSIVQRSLASATKYVGVAIERMSTGYRINHAADDAAGLMISEGLRSQSRGATQAMKNAQTGINLLQTAEGDLEVIQSNLQRIRDLTVQAANGTYGTAERTAISEEVTARILEVNRIASSSSFNKIKLLDGTGSTLNLQIGANSAASTNALDISAPLASATASALGVTTSISVAYASGVAAASFISEIDSAVSTVSSRRAQIGSLQNRLESTIQSLTVKSENLTAAESRIRDANIAEESANFTKFQILQQASASLLAQANQAPSIALSLI